MSPKQMASVLDLAAVTLRRYVRDGRVPYRILPSGRIRFEPSKVLAALAVEVPAKKP
jgi:predicted site-specific integrase-resolvase